MKERCNNWGWTGLVFPLGITIASVITFGELFGYKGAIIAFVWGGCLFVITFLSIAWHKSDSES
jgi:hypothetical protein